jgi:threonine/homoserine/homoserine lactone efflux protein
MTEDALRSFAPLWMMLAYCATPGAVNAETLRRGLRGGFGAALLVQLGAVAGRVVWAALALAGTDTLAGSEPLRFGLAALGAVLILRTAWNALSRQPAPGPAVCRERPVPHGELAAGFLLSITNPLALVFWSGLGLAGGAVDVPDASSMVPSLTAGALIWSVGAAYAIGYGRRTMGRSTLRCAELLTGGALGFFGLRLLWDSACSLSSAAGF